MNLLFVSFGIALALCLFTIFLLFSGPSAESALLEEVTGHAHLGNASEPSGLFPVELLVKPFTWFRGLFGRAPQPVLTRRLMRAGYREPYHTDVFIGAKLLLPVIMGTLVALTIRENVIFSFVIALTVA